MWVLGGGGGPRWKRSEASGGGPGRVMPEAGGVGPKRQCPRAEGVEPRLPESKAGDGGPDHVIP